MKKLGDNQKITTKKLLITAPEPEPAPGAGYAQIVCDSLDEAPGLRPAVRSTINGLTTQIDVLDVQIAELKAQKAELETMLGDTLDANKIRTLSWGDYSCGFVHSGNSHLSKDLLLANGVQSAIIAASKVSSKYRYFKFTNRVRMSKEQIAHAESA